MAVRGAEWAAPGAVSEAGQVAGEAPAWVPSLSVRVSRSRRGVGRARRARFSLLALALWGCLAIVLLFLTLPVAARAAASG